MMIMGQFLQRLVEHTDSYVSLYRCKWEEKDGGGGDDSGGNELNFQTSLAQ